MYKKKILFLMSCVLTMSLILGCGEKKSEDKKEEIVVFVAASLGEAMDEIKENYEKEHGDVYITYNKDSSGKLSSQINEGAECDIFFSAAQGKMDYLEDEGLIKKDTRTDLVENRLILIKGKNVESEVTGLNTIAKAKSMALADGSVPVGKYTRIALVNNKLIKSNKSDPGDISTKEVSLALNGLEISEQSNVSKVLTSIIEESSEVGTIYYSGIYGVEKKVTVIEEIPIELTGPIVYPAAIVKDSKKKGVDKFFEYLKSDEAKGIFEKHLFTVN